MRDDPIDREDALFIVERSGLTRAEVAAACQQARVPDIPELQEQFKAASARLLAAL